MTSRFIVQIKKKAEKGLIVFQLFHKQKIWNYGTSISILPSEWNEQEQRIRKNNKQATSLNGTLASYQNVFSNVYSSFGGTFAKAKMVAPEAFKEAIDKEMIAAGLRAETKKKEIKFFLDYCQDFLQTDFKGKSKTLSTLSQYRANFEILKDYKPEALLSDINKAYFEGLQAYLYDKDYTLNSVVNVVQRTHAVLNWLTREGILTNLSYKSFEIGKEKTTQIALTIEEIDLIRNATLKENLSLARDLFLFQCLVGIRYSDVQIIQKEHFIVKNQVNYLSFYNVKTSKKIEVPLFEGEAYQIANKYDFNFKITAYNLMTINVLLKEIGQIVGLNEMIEVIDYPQGKKIIEFKPKYELIGTHTARRTFITIASNKGLTASQIGQITGQNINTVTKYIKNNDASKENDMRKLM